MQRTMDRRVALGLINSKAEPQVTRHGFGIDTRKNKQEHESVITYSVIYFFFDLFVTSIIQYHKKIKCKMLPRPGIEPVTS